MPRKPRTPEELSTGSGKKETFPLYLEVELIEYLKKRATTANVSVSALVNEAIKVYVDGLKETKKS